MSKSEWAVVMALTSESQGKFEAAGIPVHYCGIGKINAAYKVSELILKNQVKGILNLGTAGSTKLSTHDLVECSGFVQRDMDLSPLGFQLGKTPEDEISDIIHVPKFYTSHKRGVCGTGDCFEVGQTKLTCDLVDMEAYAMAKVCKKLSIPFVSIKYITDGSDSNAHNDWRENLKTASTQLVDTYQRYFYAQP